MVDMISRALLCSCVVLWEFVMVSLWRVVERTQGYTVMIVLTVMNISFVFFRVAMICALCLSFETAIVGVIYVGQHRPI